MEASRETVRRGLWSQPGSAGNGAECRAQFGEEDTASSEREGGGGVNDDKQTRAWAEESYKTRLEESAGANFQRSGTLGSQSQHLKESVTTSEQGMAMTFDKDLSKAL